MCQLSVLREGVVRGHGQLSNALGNLSPDRRVGEPQVSLGWGELRQKKGQVIRIALPVCCLRERETGKS